MSGSADITITNQCIQTAMNLGHTTYYNICTNAPALDIPWGGGDWVLGSFIAFFFVALAVFVGGMGIAIIRDH